MHVFVAHSNQDKRAAREIAEKLRAQDVDVFLDEDSLPAGEDYDGRIRAAIGACDVLVFLVSAASTAEGAYALTELGIAKRRWPNPSGRVLPVTLSAVDIETLPPYLTQGVTILRPRGNAAAETADQVLRLLAKHRRDRRLRTIWIGGASAAILAVAGVGVAALIPGRVPETAEETSPASSRPPTMSTLPTTTATASTTSTSTVPPPPTATAPKIPVGFGTLMNPGEGRCLMTTGPWAEESVLGYACGNDRQFLKFRDADRGAVQLVFEHSGMCLTAVDQGGFWQRTCDGNRAQQFVLHSHEDSELFTIESKLRRGCLALQSGVQMLATLPCSPLSSALLFKFSKR